MKTSYIITLIIIVLILVLYRGKKIYINRLREVRDDLDLTTIEGRDKLRAINNRIDYLNGYKPKKHRASN